MTRNVLSIHDLATVELPAAAADDILTWVDVGSDTEYVARAVVNARRSHRILLGVGTPSAGVSALLDALTFTLSPDGSDRRTVAAPSIADAVSGIEESVGADPIAAATFAGLSIMAENLGVHDALIAESLAYSTLQGGPEYARWLEASTFRVKPDVDEPVSIERHDNEVIITLDRPKQHNALNAAMRDALVDALSVALLDDTVTGVSLVGRGRSFSSGGDLTEFGTASDPASAHLIRTQHRPGEQIHDLTQRLGSRVEARVHGAVMGGGLELAAFAGSVVADPQSVFLLPELSMGLLPGAGGTVSVARRIGRWRAAWMVVSGSKISAAQALDWGLVDRIESIQGR